MVSITSYCIFEMLSLQRFVLSLVNTINSFMIGKMGISLCYCIFLVTQLSRSRCGASNFYTKGFGFEFRHRQFNRRLFVIRNRRKVVGPIYVWKLKRLTHIVVKSCLRSIGGYGIFRRRRNCLHSDLEEVFFFHFQSSDERQHTYVKRIGGVE